MVLVDRRPAEGSGECIGPQLFGLPAPSFVTTPSELAYSVLLQTEIRKRALRTVQTSIRLCTYVCRSLKECVHLLMAIAVNKHTFSPSANQIPSEVVVSSDASLTLKGLSFSVSLTPLVFYMYHLSVLCSVTCSWIL